MADTESIRRPHKPDTWLTTVAGDAHFWVPTLVLIGGLLLLRWVS